MYRTEFEANLSGFSCFKASANVMASQKQEACRFPIIKIMCYALSVMVALAVAKPVIF